MRTDILLFVIAFLTIPLAASAYIELNIDYPEFGDIVLDCTPLPAGKICGQDLNTLIGWLYYAIVGLSGLAAFVMLIWGGIQWLLSGAVPSQASEARDRVRNAILGLLLILASVLIVQVINPELTVLKRPDLERFSGSVPVLSQIGAGGSGGLPAPGPGGGTADLTIDGGPDLTLPFPASSSHTLDWSTTLTSSVVCTASTDSSPANPSVPGLWNHPSDSAPTSGPETIDLSTVTGLVDPTVITFTLVCNNASNTVQDQASIFIQSGPGGTPPTITQFEVTDHNQPTTWLPGVPVGSPIPTYDCCGNFPAPSDFPVSGDIRVRWNSTDATECWGEDALAGHINGGPSSISDSGTIVKNVSSWGPYTFRLRCVGAAPPDAVWELLINTSQP
jgi:hypothetical protein